MKTVVTLPRGMEVEKVEVDEAGGKITLHHRFLGKQASAPALYLTAEGKQGQKRETILMVSGNNGRYTVVEPEAQSAPVAFDKPKRAPGSASTGPTAPSGPTAPTEPEVAPPPAAAANATTR